MSAGGHPRGAVGLTLLLALGCIVNGARVVEACRPTVPLFDHAVLLADMLHHPPHLFRGHNEHLPVLPRLVFQLEAWLTDGNTWVGVVAGVSALFGGAALVCRVWRPGRLVWGVVLAAALLRPSLAWAVSWPTNVQYTLAWLGAGVAALGLAQGRVWLGGLGAVMAGLSSAEGWLVLPLMAGAEAILGRRSRALGWALVTVVAAALATLADTAHSGLSWPGDGDELEAALVFVGRLLAFPWSVKLAAAVAMPFVGWTVWRLRRDPKVDPSLAFAAVYGLGFTGLVVVGRWWLPDVAHRYAFGPTIAVVTGLLAVAGGGLAGRDRAWLALGIAAVLGVESAWLAPDVVGHCRAETPAGTPFWMGVSDDGRSAHPGYDPSIALELRTHLWDWGLYRPRESP